MDKVHANSTLHSIRIRPYVPEQRIPGVTVRTNEYLPDPDVKVSHIKWYEVSWEMDFGRQIDESTTKEATHPIDEAEMQEVTEKQTEITGNAEPPSSDFSNLTTDVGDNPYIRTPSF